MTELGFKKYNSIECPYNSEFMEKVREEVPSGTVFVVQEKVHGSNVSFVCSLPEGEIRFAKRTGFVEPDENFFGCAEFIPRYEERIRKVCRLVKRIEPSSVSCCIFGEMFGGAYPHPDVKRISSVKPIQKGVFYCPTHEFYAFDIFCVTDKTAYYLPVDSVNRIFSEAGLLYAETLFEGSLADCLEFPNAFRTTVPEKLGLPPIEDNICEGIVVRPKVPLNLKRGERVMIKSKNPRFSEKKSQKVKVPKEEIPLSDEFTELLSSAYDYVTEPRIGSVRSKIGEMVFPREFGKMLGLYCKDVLEDFLKEYGTSYCELERKEQKLFNKRVNKICADFLREKLLGSAPVIPGREDPPKKD